MTPSTLERIGMLACLLGCTAAVVTAWLLAGLAWSLAVFAVLALATGVVLIRTAALTPPTGGDDE